MALSLSERLTMVLSVLYFRELVFPGSWVLSFNSGLQRLRSYLRCSARPTRGARGREPSVIL